LNAGGDPSPKGTVPAPYGEASHSLRSLEEHAIFGGFTLKNKEIYKKTKMLHFVQHDMNLESFEKQTEIPVALG